MIECNVVALVSYFNYSYTMSPALLHMTALRDTPINSVDVTTLVLVSQHHNHLLFFFLRVFREQCVSFCRTKTKALYFERRRELLCNHSPLLHQRSSTGSSSAPSSTSSTLGHASALARLALHDRANEHDARQRRFVCCNLDSPHAHRFAANVSLLWYVNSFVFFAIWFFASLIEMLTTGQAINAQRATSERIEQVNQSIDLSIHPFVSLVVLCMANSDVTAPNCCFCSMRRR